MRSTPSGSDTGRVKQLTVYSADGLAVIRGAGDVDIETVEAEMLEELSADVILRVRIRVGTYGGHPSLERGSTVWVRSPNVAGNLTSDRSLISNIRVVEEERDEFGGVALDIRVVRYEQGVEFSAVELVLNVAGFYRTAPVKVYDLVIFIACL